MNCTYVENCLVDFLEGDLPADEAGEIQRHLATCPTCEIAARETRILLGDLSSARSVDGSASAPVAELTGLKPATVIADFEVLSELGRGGMGIVYRARQLTLQREVALKILSPALAQVPRSVERFRREAQAAARLHHTNIVPVYAQGLADGHLYYAMELIAGESLDEVLAAERIEFDVTASQARGGASRVGHVSGSSAHRRNYRRIALRIASVAEALAHAHEQRVIHRDIKPQNLILGTDGHLHITDFGLARLTDEPGLTLSRDLVGTPIYMAPEQVSGGKIDGRTDVYALGMTLYEMLALRKPFSGDTYESIIRQVLNSDPVPPRKVDRRIPVDLETICLRAIEKEPQRRFASAADMAADLRRYAEQFPIASRRISLPGRIARWTRRHPAQAAVIGLLVTIAALLPALTWFSQRRAEAQINNAWEVLLADYHQGDAAMAQLGWLTGVFGDRERAALVQALAHLLKEPDRARRILEELLEHRDLADAHYLLAWAHRVRTASNQQAWEAVFAQLEAGDNASVPATAAGHFFKGVTLIPLDPERAERALEEAIITRSNFTQAWLQQGRAIQQILYLYGGLDDYSLAIEKYNKGVSRLRPAAQLARQNSYPSYLLSNAHRFAALLSRQHGDQQAADERFKACLEDARAAQRANPENAHGFAAEASYHEARTDYRTAIALWEQVAQRGLRAHQVLERAAYQMRLHLWLGEYDEAAAMHGLRYSPAAGYDPQRYDADETLFMAVLLACRGERDAAAELLEHDAPRAESTSAKLLLAAAGQLLGVALPARTGDLARDASLPPRWPAETVARIQDCLRGGRTPDELVASAEELLGGLPADQQRLAEPFLLSGLHFYAGVGSIARGDHAAGRRHFEVAARMHDSENYCFRAALLAGCFEGDRPRWIGD